MNKEIPPDDQGINTEYVLEISEKIIRRAWKEVSDEDKEISLDNLEKIIRITDASYSLAVRALEIGYNLTQDYLAELDNNFDDEDDEDDEDLFNEEDEDLFNEEDEEDFN